MTEYINRELAENIFLEEQQELLKWKRYHQFNKDEKEEYDRLESYRDKIKALPSVEIDEIQHGEWELKSEMHYFFDDVDEEFYVECPFCNRTFYVPCELMEADMLRYAREHYPYCHCGARMDGGK